MRNKIKAESTVFVKIEDVNGVPTTNLFKYHDEYYYAPSLNEYTAQYQYPGVSDDIKEGFYRIAEINEEEKTFSFMQAVDIEKETPTKDELLEFAKKFQSNNRKDYLSYIEEIKNDYGTHYYILSGISPLRIFRRENSKLCFETNNLLRSGKVKCISIQEIIKSFGKRLEDKKSIYQFMLDNNYPIDSFIGHSTNGYYIDSQNDDNDIIQEALYELRGRTFAYPENQYGREELDKPVYMWEFFLRDFLSAKYINDDEIESLIKDIKESKLKFKLNFDAYDYESREPAKVIDSVYNDTEIQDLLHDAYYRDIIDLYTTYNMIFIDIPYINIDKMISSFDFDKVKMIISNIKDLNNIVATSLGKRYSKGRISNPFA